MRRLAPRGSRAERLDASDEPVAMLRHGLDERGPRRVVAEVAPQRLDALRERLVSHRDAAPHFVEEAVFRDKTAAFADQQRERIEVATVDVDRGPVPAQLAIGGIELEAIEAEAAGRHVFSRTSGLAHAAHRHIRQSEAAIINGGKCG
jgi:hypothetical protein